MAVKTKRATTEALIVPQNDAEADALLKLYGERANDLARLGADMKDRLAEVKAEFQGQAKPLQDELRQLLSRLQAFAGANRTRLTNDGKTKSYKLPAGVIGWRDRPPSVRFTAKVEEIVERIRAANMKRFLRMAWEPNKQAMLADAGSAGLIEGVKVGSAGEEFYVAPFGAELAELDQ